MSGAFIQKEQSVYFFFKNQTEPGSESLSSTFMPQTWLLPCRSVVDVCHNVLVSYYSARTLNCE